MKRPTLIVQISRGIGFDERRFKARDVQVTGNSTIVITDVHGETHYLPKTMWERFEVKQAVGNVEVPQGVT